MYERKCPTEALEDDLHLLAFCLPRSKRHVCAIIPFAIGSAPAGENVGLYVDFGAIDGGGTAQVASALLGLDYEVNSTRQIGNGG
jgi:hypothetical protein